MEHPVLVRAYTGRRIAPGKSRNTNAASLPPISAYAFANIVRSADGPEFQSAIEGIANICAKNKLSLAEEYAAHRPPVGEITEASSRNVGPQLRKPGMRRALTSVPEGSSSSSEGSRRSKRRNIFGFRGREEAQFVTTLPRVIRIGSMGRSISVAGITAIAEEDSSSADPVSAEHQASTLPRPPASTNALTSLQRLLGTNIEAPD